MTRVAARAAGGWVSTTRVVAPAWPTVAGSMPRSASADYCSYINEIPTVSELQRDQYKYAMREDRTVFWGAVMIIIVLALGALGG
jgi:hypothetical protein